MTMRKILCMILVDIIKIYLTVIISFLQIKQYHMLQNVNLLLYM